MGCFCVDISLDMACINSNNEFIFGKKFVDQTDFVYYNFIKFLKQ